MFNNDDEEPFENNNDKYIMFSKDEKDIKIENSSFDNEIKNEFQNEINTEENNEMIPSFPYKPNIEEKENLENENEINEKDDNQNIISNDYDEVKMNIKNYLKDKIEKENIDTNENNDKENINNNNYSDLKERNNLTEPFGNNDPNAKSNLTQVQITNSSMSKGLKNLVINSTKTSIESLGNSIDNYIKMENLYLQDGKITNYEISNTNNLTTNNNKNDNDKDIVIKNSKKSINKLNEMRN